MATHYEELGVSKDAGCRTIKKAYRKLALQNHPDKNPTDKENATTAFQKIGKAFEILKSPTQRSQYDAELLLLQQQQRHTFGGFTGGGGGGGGSGFASQQQQNRQYYYPQQQQWQQQEQWQQNQEHEQPQYTESWYRAAQEAEWVRQQLQEQLRRAAQAEWQRQQTAAWIRQQLEEQWRRAEAERQRQADLERQRQQDQTRNAQAASRAFDDFIKTPEEVGQQQQLKAALESLYQERKGRPVFIQGKESLDLIPGSILKEYLKSLKGAGFEQSQYFIRRKLKKTRLSTSLRVAELRQNVAHILGL